MTTIPKAQRIHLTAQVVTQSKEFREKSKFENWMMILCNTVAPSWDNGAGARFSCPMLEPTSPDGVGEKINSGMQGFEMASPIINFQSILGYSISAQYENLPAGSQVVLVNNTSGKPMPSPVTSASGTGPLSIQLPNTFPGGAYLLQAQDQSGSSLAKSVEFYVA